jgi:PIN domain nuclease of toxin-antitoxin system
VSLLADACALIVFHGYAGQTMSHAGKAAMSKGDVFVCPITVWEIARKIALDRLQRPAPPGFNGSLSEWLRRAGYRVLPMKWDACERANALPTYHKDPMDRMLIALALDRGMTVITDDDEFARYTDDDEFARYGVATIW